MPNVKLPTHRVGLPGKVFSFYIMPLNPAFLPTGWQARRGLRGTFRPKLARSDERSESSSNEIQSPNGRNYSSPYQQRRNVLTLGHFNIPLTFACLREAASAKAGILTFELPFIRRLDYW
jgi:hypothetical protein